MLCKTRFILLLVLLLPFPLFAQINTGTILGTVRDAQGAVIPGADVTVTLTDLGISVDLSTNEAGVFQASGLRPGVYEARAETAGFKAAVRSGIQLAIQQRLEIDFTLEVGSVTEEVQVVAAAVDVETGSGQLGTVIESDVIADLPLDGRRYSDLILLSPGAVPAPGANPIRAKPGSTSMAISLSKTTLPSMESTTTRLRPMPRNGVLKQSLRLLTRCNPSRSRRAPMTPSSDGARVRSSMPRSSRARTTSTVPAGCFIATTS